MQLLRVCSGLHVSITEGIHTHTQACAHVHRHAHTQIVLRTLTIFQIINQMPYLFIFFSALDRSLRFVL